MHKRIKHIIAASLIISAIGGIAPGDKLTFGIGSIKAYASSHNYDDDEDNYDDDEDEALLSDIYLSDGDISFDEDETEYDVNVGKDVDKITVRAKPESDYDTVEINGDSVNEDDDYERKINLKEGNNTIKIYVENDNDDNKTYNLNVYRGDKKDDKNSVNTDKTVTDKTVIDKTVIDKTANVPQNFAISTDAKKNNAWQRVDGNWKYVDGTGQYLKSTWWFDKTNSQNYYLDKDGNRTKGWFYDNNHWYYLNENGEMQTGWICLNKIWYFLGKSGVMQIGWYNDSSGNWYFMDENGAMKTGWVENSDGKWYYFDSTGKMIKDSTINGYTLDNKGELTN